MTVEQKILAIEEIKNLKSRYWRGADQRDRALLRSTFADDLVWDATAGATVDGPTKGDPSELATSAVIHGGDKVTEMLFTMWGMMGDRAVRGMHHGGAPDIEITGPTTAKGIWPFIVVGRPNATSPFATAMIGYYYETYELTDGSWKIKTLKTRPQG